MGIPVELAQFPPTDFAALAEAAGCRGVTARTLDDLEGVREWLGATATARSCWTPKSTPTSVPNGLRRHFVATEQLAAGARRRLRPRRRPHAAAERDARRCCSSRRRSRTRPASRARTISRFDDAGPAWAWTTLTVGEHVGTHFDAPIHWITGRDGEDVASVAPSKLVAPAAVIDKSAEAAEDPNYLLTLADIQAWENEHGPLPPGGWLLLRTGWDARAHDQEAFLNGGETPGPDAESARWLAETSRDRRLRRARPSAPTPAPPTPSTRRSRSTTSCSARASTA